MDRGRLVQAGPVAEIIGSGGTVLVSTAGRGPEPRRGQGRRAGRRRLRRSARTTACSSSSTAPAPATLVADLVRLDVAVTGVGPHRRLEDAFLTLIWRIRMSSADRIRLRRPPATGPGRTLPLRVELVRQLRRRRTLDGRGARDPAVHPDASPSRSAARPGGDEDGGGGTWIDLAATGGPRRTSPPFACSSRPGFLLVVPVALFCGDTVASEASWSSLRYLLAAPVPRARLLRQKLVVAVGLSAWRRSVLLPVVALVAGTVAYGWGAAGAARRRDRRRPLPTRAGAGWRSWSATSSSPNWSPALAFWLSVSDRRAARRGRRRGRPDHRRQRPGRGHRARRLAGLPARALAVRLGRRAAAPDEVDRHDRGRGDLGDVRAGAVRARVPRFRTRDIVS